MTAILAALVLVPAATSAPTAGFVPSAIAGEWTGTWHNVTFGSTGPAFMNVTSVRVAPKKVVTKVRVKGKLRKRTKLVPQPPKLRVVYDFGGNVFGCADPASEATVLTKGQGPKHWNAAGFEMMGTSVALGTVHLVYDFAAQTLEGEGENPSCAGGLKWSLDGRFPDPNTFAGTVSITLPSGFAATSDLALTRG